ncbi:hypothetical protein [Mesorhizobium sp. YM1C-6-2]|uniref:hypothetical protein n=1 Tax=Mesorhizobium sp. YM1C-6-2 TaxID=1827501 RepID=UPI0011C40179|nr:hypothetical protein [Mesorhizobium sp. YM1C-6-2]
MNMRRRGVANREQLAMMARVMAAYCGHFSIPDDTTERDRLAFEIIVLFDNGIRDEEALLAEMIRLRSMRH